MSRSSRLSEIRSGHPIHQDVMVDSIKEFFQIDVNHPVVAFGDIGLCLSHGLMGRATRSEPVAVLRERRVPAPLQDLQNRLLDQAIDNTGDAELSDPAVRFGDFDSPHRLRLVGPVEQLFPNGWPVLTQVVPGLVDGPAIDAGTPLVGADSLPRIFEVLSFAHLLHQRLSSRRAFGFSLRRG